MILRVAVPVPLNRLFDYLAPAEQAVDTHWCGRRVRVQFGNRNLIGMIVQVVSEPTDPRLTLKPIVAVLDDAPLFTPQELTLCEWASRYYHAPIGEVVSAFLPKLLRDGGACEYRKARQKKSPPQPPAHDTPRILNDEQQHAVTRFEEHAAAFFVMLLDGITGSGKTEVYLHAIARVLATGKQVLVLVPEIGLTPQTIARFSARFDVPIALAHSRLTPRERLDNWLLSRDGKARIVIGTRSALFMPLPDLGLIIIDEEHDSSFKQQEGFRYGARDVAIKLAHLRDIPIILGSATPSIESLHNVTLGKFSHCILRERAGSAILPIIEPLDLRHQKCVYGISPLLEKHIESHLTAGNQVLLFINRRGYSPVLLCHQCGWIAQCDRCEIPMTVHAQPRQCICHHCLATRPVPSACGACKQSALVPVGYGTERIEEYLQSRFPDNTLLRIDHDSTRKKGSMQRYLDNIHDEDAQILLGTQMLAKGHHFPKVTLVGILDADGGVYSADFRAMEKLGQLIVQVAGRAGRGETPGNVYIQTHHPDHPMLKCLINEGYHAFAQRIMADRDAAQLPPYTHAALFRSQALHRDDALKVLQTIKHAALPYATAEVELLGPVPAPMEKRANVYRAQLLLKSPHRKALHHALTHTLAQVETLRMPRGVKWSLDVDPVDLF